MSKSINDRPSTKGSVLRSPLTLASSSLYETPRATADPGETKSCADRLRGGRLSGIEATRTTTARPLTEDGGKEVKRAILACVFFLPLGVLSCGDDGSSDARNGAEWSYDGDTGPQHWGDLSPSYATCAAGVEQSPIDIVGVAPAQSPALEIDYHGTPLVIVNNGHTVEVEYHEGSTLSVDGHSWEVVQFHFHARSEHTVGGTSAPMEMHIVHRDEDGGLAVLGVFIEEGAENQPLAAVFDHLPTEPGDPEEIEGVEVSVADALPGELAAWRYDGSLTTPPCSQGVRWHVLSTPIEASAAQIRAFEAIFDHNFRPTQPLHGRVIG
jgi:carbonic anhydrase